MKNLIMLCVFLFVLSISGCEKSGEECWMCEVWHFEVVVTLNGKELYGWKKRPTEIYCPAKDYSIKKLEKNSDVWRRKCHLEQLNNDES